MLGTNEQAGGTTQAAFTANGNSLISSVRGIGCTADIFIATSTMLNNVTSATLQAAQAALINNGQGIYTLGNMDSLTGGTNRQGDGTHLTLTGEDSWAAICTTTFQNHY